MAIPEKELAYHYSPSQWSHRDSADRVIEMHVSSTSEGTKLARWSLETSSRVYGTGPNQKLDIFDAKDAAQKKGLPIFVYLHGGYWQDLSLDHAGFMAPNLCKAGVTVISVGYDLAPQVTMDKIVSEVKEAMRYIITYAKDRQSRGIYLCGHSAGAHLCAMMLASEFAEGDAFDSELIKGAFLVSGVYDLRPLTKTYINDPLKLTEDDAWNFSPAKFIAEIASQSQKRDILIAVGEYDPPEFKRQSAEMEKELFSRRIKARFMQISDVDHFDIVEKLQKPSYTLTQELIRLMKQ